MMIFITITKDLQIMGSNFQPEILEPIKLQSALYKTEMLKYQSFFTYLTSTFLQSIEFSKIIH